MSSVIPTFIFEYSCQSCPVLQQIYKHCVITSGCSGVGVVSILYGVTVITGAAVDSCEGKG